MPHQNRVHTFGTSSSVGRVRCSLGSGQISSSIFSWHSCQFPRNSAFAIGASGLAVTAAATAAAIVAVTMSLTKAQQNAYKKMKEQKNKAPAGQTAEGKAKSKADAEAHVCQVG